MKKFAGFTPQQQYTLLTKQGYNGPADETSMAKFLAASPAAASKMGEYAQIAQQRLAGRPMPSSPVKMAVGGMAPTGNLEDLMKAITPSAKAQTKTTQASPIPTATPVTIAGAVTPYTPTPEDLARMAEGEAARKRGYEQRLELGRQRARETKAEQEKELERIRALSTPQAVIPTTTPGPELPAPTTSTRPQTMEGVMQSSVTDPMSVVPRATVQGIPEAPGTTIAEGTGQVQESPVVTPATISAPTLAAAPVATPAATITPVTVSGQTPQATAAQGTVGEKSLVEAQTLSPEELAQLSVDKPQTTDPTQVIPPPPRQVEAGEIISGSAVDMAKVNEAMDIQAAEADPSKMATVQGQLESLMQQFEGGQTPAWAAGAMRQATATLAARGLGASSMAGQAVIQATMEAVMPIAMADAQTRAAFEAQNLSNRQQTALFAAEQRAKFLGMEFDQNFQTRVLNAAKVSDIANMNFTAEVQVALENARLTQTANLANLDVSKAKMLSDMAAMTQVDLTNLNNRQQVAVQNAQAFLQTDFTNLTNQQQTAIFNTQAKINALFSDQAAQNAAKQFNAASENQTNQFFSELQTIVSRFNAEQQNAIAQFNAGEVNSAEKFNVNVKALRDQFNANNSLIIAQANALWRQNIATANTTAQNEANATAAKVASGFTQTTIDNIWQRERDIMSAALTTAEGDADRLTSIMLGEMTAATATERLKAGEQAAKSQLFVEAGKQIIDWIF